MIYNWFKIFNKTAFEATGLVSKTYSLMLEGVGQKDILVTKGNLIGMTVDGVFLGLEMGDHNPFEFDVFAIYLDDLTGDVYLGILVPDEN